MKHYKTMLMLALGSLFLQGCIAFPPLVQVEHKQAPAPPAPPPAGPSNEEVLRRLDSIDHRLDQLEKQNQSK